MQTVNDNNGYSLSADRQALDLNKKLLTNEISISTMFIQTVNVNYGYSM
jgi:hypothetical protein